MPSKLKIAITGDLSHDYELTEGLLELMKECEVVRALGIHSGATSPGEVQALVRGLESEDAGAEDLLEELTNLRWVHSLTAGVEGVVTDRLLERGVVLTNSAGCYAEGIAEYVLSGMVSMFRGLPEMFGAKRTGSWTTQALGREVAGSRVGVVGYGGIGRRVAELATASGAQVWVIRRDPRRTEGLADASAIWVSGLDSLPAMLKVSDVVIVATSLNPSSRHLFGKREFAAMKSSAFLINVSRGAVIDEEALWGALESGSIAGALIDTTATEPLPSDSRLWSVANLWITPHIAGGTREGRARALSLLEWNLSCYCRGELAELCNVVDIARELRG